MKKNGFIATSILYSFFLVFITLFVALIMNYLHNQVLISAIDEAAWNKVLSINNTKISNLKVGDHIQFRNKVGFNCETANRICYLNENATWTVADVIESGNNKTYFFLSDLNAQLLSVNYKLSTDLVISQHPMTIDLHNTLKNNGAYTNALAFPGIQITLPTVSLLKKVRNSNIDENIKTSILGVGGSYIVHINEATPGYTTGAYYELRTYNFSTREQALSIIPKYCGGSFNGSTVNYNANNSFGYIHTTTGISIGNATNPTDPNQEYIISNTIKYVDYCSYASPIAYSHSRNEYVVDMDENKPNDLIANTSSTSYHLRLMANVTVDKNSNSTFIAGGKGTQLDPYILTNGGKQS